jgi:cobalt/nickel transport system ATP-binding protein
MTLIVASHDLELVRAVCRRVVILDGGKIVADGTAESVLEDAALLKAHGLTGD